MAGRIRSIKPEILEDEKTAGLEHVEWRLFVSLFLIADDHGNLRADPAYVRGQTMWATKETSETIAKSIAKLAQVGLVQVYSVRGQRYMHILGWKKHQRVTNPGKPRMPGPADADSIHCESREDFLEPTETRSSDLRETRDERRETKTEGDPRARAHDPPPPVPAPVQDTDQRTADRRAILHRVHATHREVYERVRIAVESDARPMAAVGDPAERALSKHLLELVTLESAEADCLHAIAVAEDEAIRKRSVQYLGASVWSPNSFARAMAKSVGEADGKARDPSVGRYEPLPSSAYGIGEQTL